MPSSKLARALQSLSRTSHDKTEGTRRPPISNKHPSQSSYLLALPRELRNEIYSHVRVLPSIKIKDIYAGQYLNFDAQGLRREDSIPFQPPASSGLLLFYGIPPPMTLLLVCRQIHEEVLDHFFSLTTFEVGPLTPHHDEWRMDPTYQKLRNSVHLSRVQKLKVRVNLERMQMASSEGLSNHDGARFSEIGLEECVLKVQPLSEMLVRVLRNGAKNLKMITIDWKDEFPEDINWQLKSSVLFPFGNLEGVQFRLGRVKMADRARTAYEERLKETLEGLSA